MGRFAQAKKRGSDRLATAVVSYPAPTATDWTLTQPNPAVHSFRVTILTAPPGVVSYTFGWSRNGVTQPSPGCANIAFPINKGGLATADVIQALVQWATCPGSTPISPESPTKNLVLT